jgi:hypothetical protein
LRQDALEFRLNFHSYTLSNRKIQANRIFSTYIAPNGSLNTKFPPGIGDNVDMDVLFTSVKTNLDHPDPRMFDDYALFAILTIESMFSEPPTAATGDTSISKYESVQKFIGSAQHQIMLRDLSKCLVLAATKSAKGFPRLPPPSSNLEVSVYSFYSVRRNTKSYGISI